MTDSLHAAAALADKLGGNFDAILPETEPVIDCDALAADRMELRQVAGISAGGTLELRPGNYDFGPVSRGPGRLEDGDPETVGFTLSLDGDLSATVGPGSGPLLLDDEAIAGPTDLDGRVINAGSARFVVARPRPPRRRGGPIRDLTLADVDPWVLQPIPGAASSDRELPALVAQRRRLHHGPDEIHHRIETGASLWERDPSHPLFGTAVVAMADITLRGAGIEVAAPVPVAINLLDSTTMIVGERRLQLAVARHILLALAAATHPDDLCVAVLSNSRDLDFAASLPHAQEPERRVTGPEQVRQLLVVDQPAEHGRWTEGHWANGQWVAAQWTLAGFDGERTSILALTGADDLMSADADVLTITDEAKISILGSGGQAPIDGATPVGFARSMAVDLVGKLRLLRGLDPIDD